MKVSITEFRDMVAEAVRRTLREAKKKPKDVPPHSEESVAAKREKMVRALPGYAHGQVLDMSKPLGKRNVVKRQGQANMGSWTSESRVAEAPPGMSRGDMDPSDSIAGIVDILTSSGMSPKVANKVAIKIVARNRHASVAPGEHGLDDPAELGIEQKTEAIRHLIRMIVDEEVRVRGR